MKHLILEERDAPLIKDQKQSINQVYINHPDLLYFSKTEFYHLIDDELLNTLLSFVLFLMKYPCLPNYLRKKTNNKSFFYGIEANYIILFMTSVYFLIFSNSHSSFSLEAKSRALWITLSIS